MDFGVNFNGDLPMGEMKKRSAAAEHLGFNHIWVGESRALVHPFALLPPIASSTRESTVGTGVISALGNRCFHINKAFSTLKEMYGERFIAGLAPGDLHGLKVECVDTRGVMERLDHCVSRVDEVPVYIGASGPKLIGRASRERGIILNYIAPEHVEWALQKREKKAYTACIGPALILPERKNEKELLYASGVVAAGANQVFLEEQGLYEEAHKVNSKVARRDFRALKEHRDFLLENFALCGTEEEVVDRVKELEKLGVDQVVFGSPFVKSYRLERAEEVLGAFRG